jgi:hypothetical protein
MLVPNLACGYWTADLLHLRISIGLLQPHSDDMSRVVDQLLKLIATFIGLSRFKHIWNHLMHKCVY